MRSRCQAAVVPPLGPRPTLRFRATEASGPPAALENGMSDVTLKVTDETHALDVNCVQMASLRPFGFAYFGGSFRPFAARIAFPYTRNSRNRGVLDF